jgi:saccharopine dehydrogenase-like NADP-dependent oxidoreductase
VRVVQLGVGSVGEVIARTLADQDDVTEVVLVDVDEDRLRQVATRLPGAKASHRALDVRDGEQLTAVLHGADAAVNALVPEFNLEVMRACLEARCHYLDLAAGGPREILGTPDMDEQFALGDAFREQGVAALLFCGIDPGASDVFARALYDELEVVEELVVYDGDGGWVESHAFATSFSPAVMVEECLLVPPERFEDGRFVQSEPLTVSAEFAFPDPVGPMRVWHVDHEEPALMAQFLGDKGLRFASFFIGLADPWVELLRSWRRLGFDHKREIEFEGCRFRPFDLLVSRLPRSVDLIGKMHGSVCVGTLASGRRDGEPVRRFMYQITSHDEAYRRLGVQGTGYQTGVPGACGTLMLLRDQVGGPGVWAPEQLDPSVFLTLMSELGCPADVVDLPVGD